MLRHMEKVALFVLSASVGLAPLGASQAPTRVETVLAFAQDKDGNAISASSPGSIVIFEKRGGNPVLAPDGHPVTLSEFSAVRGAASVKCLPQGTQVSLLLSGLVPRGVYTIWLLTFQAPGFDAGGLNNLLTVSALGDPSGNGNIIYADENGLGELSQINPGGPISTQGTIANCFTQDEFEVHVVGAYHIDNTTHGATPGPVGSFVEQFGFRFRQTVRPFAAIKDANGNAMDGSTSMDAPVFEGRTGAPVAAPDGHQLTLGQFRAVNGTVAARCTTLARAPGFMPDSPTKGTIVSMHLNGLIPNGVYTVWLMSFGPSGPAGGPKAVGALGPFMGSGGNSFVADQNGEADITAVNPAGALSMTGSVGGCWLTDEAEVHVLGAYHIDGQTHGGVPGSPDTWVEQFEFDFVRQ